MSRPVLALALLSAIALSVTAQAEQQVPNYDKLKQTLEQKFAPAPTRSLAPAEEQLEKKDFQWIDPGKSGTPGSDATNPANDAPKKLEGPNDRTGSTLWGSIYGYLREQIGGTSAGSSQHLVSPGTLTAGTTAKVKIGDAGPPAARPPENELKVAQAEVPIAKKNSFVIQLKPDAKEEEISALLQKYDLTVTKIIGDLGVITVEKSAEPATGSGSTRSLAAPSDEEIERTADPKKKLEKILAPPIVQELRKESIVESAIVNSTMGTKLLPKPSGAKIQSDGKTYSWQWTPAAEPIDGNWGLKTIRMPPVWTVLDRYRKHHDEGPRPKIGIIDSGFTTNPNVTFQSMRDVHTMTVLRPNCSTHHAMHVAGIIGGRQTDTPGIDGMVPDARIDAVAISSHSGGEAGTLGVEELWELQTLVFDEVLGKTMEYLIDNVENPDNLRVINISLGYNFLVRKLVGESDLEQVSGLKLHIHHQANIIRRMAQRVEGKVLFVVAAGNDSDDRPEPLEARWASPFAWAGTFEGVNDKPAKNILVVEASDRQNNRASFSNTGGHVSAPGVDIMSTLASGAAAFAVCSGTSQAAPHASALAAILFELDPTKTPIEVIDIIKSSASKPPEGSGAAPAIDALEAVLKLSSSNVARLADLDDDGKVSSSDVASFKNQVAEITAAATTEAPFTTDLNGDGVVDDNECHWPEIDLNGSGFGSPGQIDFRRVGGLYRTDLNMMALAWPDGTDTFNVALADNGLSAQGAELLTAGSPPDTKPPVACRRRDTAAASSTVTATVTTPPSPEPQPSSEATTPTTVADATAPAPTETAATGTTPAPTEPSTPATPATGETVVADATATTPATGLTSAAGASPEAVRAEVEKAIEALKKANPKLRVTINPATGLPSSISGIAPRSDVSSALAASPGEGEAVQSEDDTKRAVESFFASGGLAAALPTRNVKARNEYTGRKRDPDFPDRFVATVEQRVGDVPVFGSDAKLTVDGIAGVTKYVGTPSAVAIDDVTAKISEADAIEAARGKLDEITKGGPDDMPQRAIPDLSSTDATAKLVVFDPALINKKTTGATRLAWLVSIDTFRIFVDAKTKEAFHYYRDQPSGMLRRIFDLENGKTFPGRKVIDEETRELADQVPDDGALAYSFTGDVRDFFFMVFGRYGFDDNDGDGPNGGSAIESYIRYSSARDAFWCPSKSYECPKANVMVYGPGYAGSIDIVGHEMTHGVIAHEKNLLYLNEPGAVNESLADIFGTLIELHARVPFGNWVIGESAPSFSEASPLRSLADPNLKTADGKSMFDRTQRFSMTNRGQPDTYAEVLTTADKQCASTRYQDNGCVHFNSGILNKMAYLISEGGEHRGVEVTGIGRFKLARIAYRTMTVQLNQSSGLVEAADAFVLSCFELADAGKAALSENDCQQVIAAQQAVGLVFGS